MRSKNELELKLKTTDEDEKPKIRRVIRDQGVGGCSDAFEEGGVW
jgi:hypothetical protein